MLSGGDSKIRSVRVFICMEKGSKRVVMDGKIVVGMFGDPKPLFWVEL